MVWKVTWLIKDNNFIGYFIFQHNSLNALPPTFLQVPFPRGPQNNRSKFPKFTTFRFFIRSKSNGEIEWWIQVSSMIKMLHEIRWILLKRLQTVSWCSHMNSHLFYSEQMQHLAERFFIFNSCKMKWIRSVEVHNFCYLALFHSSDGQNHIIDFIDSF